MCCSRNVGWDHILGYTNYYTDEPKQYDQSEEKQILLIISKQGHILSQSVQSVLVINILDAGEKGIFALTGTDYL